MGESFESAGPHAFLQEFIDEHGFLSFLDMEVIDLDAGELRLRVPFHQNLTNEGAPNGTVHGGIASTLIDTAGAMCVLSSLDAPLDSSVATIDLNVSYLRPASGDLVATATRVRTGETVGVARVTVESEIPDGTVEAVAVGRGSFRIFRPETAREEPNRNSHS
ncbi:MAG: PaaI family thioesterase [archaeon]